MSGLRVDQSLVETPAAIEAVRVSRHFRAGTRREVRAVVEVSLVVPRGAFAVLAGPSGSGKTTLLTLLGALDRPTSGTVFFQGRDLGNSSDVELTRVRRRIGFVFQQAALLPRLPLWENVTYHLIPRGVSRRERLATSRRLFERFGMSRHIDQRPEELSGGERQRAAMIRALAGEPELLLADEPTSNLDTGSIAEVIGALRELRDEGRTIVVATHDAAVIELASVAFELERGRLRTQT